MTGPLAGPGQGLQFPQNLYPSELANSPYDASSNRLCLAGGQSLVLPRGDWIITEGFYCVLQYLDPVTGTWITGASGAWEPGVRFVSSDGFDVRIANLTGCPVAATIIQYGGGWVQSSTTITVTGGGGSTWAPIVGGQLSASVTSVGAGYGVAPLVFIPPPPGNETNPNGIGGVQASGYVGISSGTIPATGFTFNNPGAGYPAIPTVVVVPSPFDPNLTSGITAATITMALTGAGSITAVLCTNNGAPVSQGALTLTPAGAGTNATIAPVQMLTCTAVSLTGTGTGLGTVAGLITSVGGAPSVGTITNGPDFLHLTFKPRPLQAQFAITNAGTAAAQLATIIDGGLFEGVPNPIQAPGQFAGQGQAGSIVGSTIALTMGTTQDIIVVQPLKT